MLHLRDQAHSAGVATALKFCGKEGLHDTLGQIGTYDARPEGEHIGVVVTAAHLRHEGIGAQGAAYAADLVGGDGDADAGGADDDALLTLAGGYGLSRRLGIDRVVAVTLVHAAEISIVQPMGIKIVPDVLLQAISAVIGTECNHDKIPPSFLIQRRNVVRLLQRNKGRLSPRVDRHVPEPGLRDERIGIPNAPGHVPGGMGVGAHGEDLTAHFSVQIQNRAPVGDGPAVIGVDLYAVAGLHHCLQDLPDGVHIAVQRDALAIPHTHIPQGVDDVAQTVIEGQRRKARHMGEIVVQRGIADLRRGVVAQIEVRAARLRGVVVERTDHKIKQRLIQSAPGGGVVIGGASELHAQLEDEAPRHPTADLLPLGDGGGPVQRLCPGGAVHLHQIVVIGDAQLGEAGAGRGLRHVEEGGVAVGREAGVGVVICIVHREEPPSEGPRGQPLEDIGRIPGRRHQSDEDRVENIRRIAEVAKLMNDAGLIVITAFISPYRHDRENAKQIIGDGFREVYVSTSIEECEKRDVKGLYKAAREGKIAQFTGITSPYEIPEHADVVVDTAEMDVETCVNHILEQLKSLLRESV